MNTKNQIKEIENILSIVTSKLEEVLSENLVEVKLFGSFARGDNKKYSDIDLLVLLKTTPSKGSNDIFDNIANEILIETGRVISFFIVEDAYFYRWQNSNDLFRTMKREGRTLFERF